MEILYLKRARSTMRTNESACYKCIKYPLTYTGFEVKAQKDIDCTGGFDPLAK
jgi:hypothetical protein